MIRLSSTLHLIRSDPKVSACASLMLFFLVMAGFFLLRYDSRYFISNSLWAEDGPVFIEAALAHPWASITAPYSGYLHVYPRLLSALATVVPVAYLPTLLAAGWLAGIMFLWHIIAIGMAPRAAPRLAASAVLLGCLLQPHTGETFLSITNAQWWLAPALALMACFPQRFSSFYSIPTLLLSLTGPFSILILVPAWFQALKCKRYAIVLPLTAGATIQLFQLIKNGRPHQVLDPELTHWLFNFATFFSWGNESVWVQCAAGVFWAIAITAALRGTWEYRSLLLCGILAYLSALYAMKGMPAALSPLGNGARYFVLPYSAVILATFLNPVLSRWQTYIAALALLAIIFTAPVRIHQQETYYSAYAKLSAYEDSLSIPLAPRIQNSPGFTLNVSAAQLPMVQYSPLLAGGTEDIYAVATNSCGGVRAVGFVVETNFPEAGYAAVRWKDSNDDGYASERRFYQAGPQRMQFAFTKNKKPVTVQFQAPAGSNPAQIGKSYFLCLK